MLASRESFYSPPAGLHNNLDAIRFWAALAVLWSHSFPVTDGSERREPLYAWSGGQATLGTVAVTCFFVISGFLITRSFERARSPWAYLEARALRIMPALAVIVFACTFVLGPLITSWPLLDYLRSSEPYRYVTLQLTFLGFQPALPGVFESNPLTAVNGPLWTLQHEVVCYGMVFVLGVLKLLNRWVTLLAYCSGLIFVGVEDVLGHNQGLMLTSTSLRIDLLTKFLAGGVFYHWGVRFVPRAAWLCLGLALLCLSTSHFGSAQRTVLPYFVMYLGLGTPQRIPSLASIGDLSYGIYIYAWPVKQLVTLVSHAHSWLLTAVVATLITLPLAWLSWVVIERPCLALKGRLLRFMQTESA
jgi:peptidoglycan/LPS O-acetylase OafA/YrhL